MPKSAISSSNTEQGSEDHTKLRRHDSLDLESSRVKGQCPAHHSAKVPYSFLNLYSFIFPFKKFQSKIQKQVIN